MVLENVNLRVAKGEFLCVIGKSGCGKTTLLNLLAGLLVPKSGRIDVNGKRIVGPGTDRAVVFQHDLLFPWMTALRNVEFGVKQARRGIAQHEARRISREILTDFGLIAELNKFPFQLSGGETQRVAIARALAMDSSVLLLDEPFGALDARTRADLQKILLKTCHQSGKTVVFVTHDLHEALLLGDKILFLSSGHVEKEVTVPFCRTERWALFEQDDAFADFKRDLVSLFYSADDSLRSA